MTESPEDCAATVARRKSPVARAQKNARARVAVIQRRLLSRCMTTLLYRCANFTNTLGTPVNRSYAKRLGCSCLLSLATGGNSRPTPCDITHGNVAWYSKAKLQGQLSHSWVDGSDA